MLTALLSWHTTVPAKNFSDISTRCIPPCSLQGKNNNVYARPPPSHSSSIASCPAPLDGISNFNTRGASTNCYVLYGTCPLGNRYMSYCYCSMSEMITKATRDSGNSIVWTGVSPASSTRASFLYIFLSVVLVLTAIQLLRLFSVVFP